MHRNWFRVREKWKMILAFPHRTHNNPKSHSFIRNSIQIENCCPTLDGLMRFFLLRSFGVRIRDVRKEERGWRADSLRDLRSIMKRGDMLLFRMNRENLNEVKIHSFLVSTMNTNYKWWVISDSRNWSRQKTFSSSSCVLFCCVLRKWKIFITKEKRKKWKSIFIVLLCSVENSGKERASNKPFNSMEKIGTITTSSSNKNSFERDSINFEKI